MLKGTGWISKDKYGCKKQGWQKEYSDLKSLYGSLAPEIIKYPVENFFRFDPASKFTMLSIALALHDAKLKYSAGKKQEIDLLGANAEGAQEANLAYFNDYLANGRILGRGNLFIYTLPSSPLAEAAIHFGLTGKLLYLGFTKNIEKESLKYAVNMLKQNRPKTILLVNSGPEKTTCRVLQG